MCIVGIMPCYVIRVILLCVAVEMMLRVCLQQMMGIHERQVTTEDNITLRQFHQQIFQEMVCENHPSYNFLSSYLFTGI